MSITIGGVTQGDRYNRLVAEAFIRKDDRHRVYWSWICDCGGRTTARTDVVKSGHTSSCGCLYKETRGVAATTHGNYNHPLYGIYYGMMDRCYNEKSGGYCNYGGRGITVCDRWRESFENFLHDMGDRPSDKHSIDRIDVDGNYEQSNCRWLTAKGQANNRTNNVYVDYLGRRYTTAEFSELIGMDLSTTGRWLRLGLTGDEIKVVNDNTFKKGLRFCNVLDVVTIITTPDTNLDAMFSNHFYIVVSRQSSNENNDIVKVVYGIIRRISIDSTGGV